MSPECDGERPCIRLGTVDLIAAVSALVPKSCNRQSPRHRDAKGCAVSSGNAQSLREPVVRSLSAGYLAGAAMICLGLSAAQAADKVTTFDVAEDHTRFHFDEQPVFEDGMPKAGNPFVTQGYIYPAGMLDGKDGVLENGAPAFADKVLGTWTCDGWFIAEGAHTKEGAWLVSRQIYHFEDSGAVFVSQGPEYVDVGEANPRPITGGTGAYAQDDVIEQTFLGFHKHGGVKVHFEIPDS
jgi:hypothetical protein